MWFKIIVLICLKGELKDYRSKGKENNEMKNNTNDVHNKTENCKFCCQDQIGVSGRSTGKPLMVQSIKYVAEKRI